MRAELGLSRAKNYKVPIELKKKKAVFLFFFIMQYVSTEFNEHSFIAFILSSFKNSDP